MVKLIIKEVNFSYSKRHLFDMLDLLVKNYDWQYVDKSVILNSKIKNFNEIEHLLLITGSSQIQDYIVPPNCKISYVIDDLHTCGEIKRLRNNNYNKVYKIFATYAYCFSKFYPLIPLNKVEWLPHSARYIIPFNNNPINKILISGRINKNQYPNRYKMLLLSKKNKFITYYKPELNGYRAKNNNDITNKIYGKKFYELLNSYLIGFTCDASKDRPYLLAKHFEIIGSGCLLFACNPNTKTYFEKLGFIDGIHYISCTCENMEEKIKWLSNISNLTEINKIRKNGYELIKQKHTFETRTNFVNTILK